MPEEAPASDAGPRESESRPEQASARTDPRPTVVFLGNSLTAGLGVDPAAAYPSLVQEEIDRAGFGFRVVNAGVSGETTAGGLARIGWIVEQEPSVLVVALGANDALRGVPPAVVQDNLRGIVETARDALPEVEIVIAGMVAPPNMGEAYADEFAAVFPDVARSTESTLIPFLLAGVAADPELNQMDGIHPTAAGHRVMASTVWAYLEPLLDAFPGRENGGS